MKKEWFDYRNSVIAWATERALYHCEPYQHNLKQSRICIGLSIDNYNVISDKIVALQAKLEAIMTAEGLATHPRACWIPQLVGSPEYIRYSQSVAYNSYSVDAWLKLGGKMQAIQTAQIDKETLSRLPQELQGAKEIGLAALIAALGWSANQVTIRRRSGNRYKARVRMSGGIAEEIQVASHCVIFHAPDIDTARSIVYPVHQGKRPPRADMMAPSVTFGDRLEWEIIAYENADQRRSLLEA